MAPRIGEIVPDFSAETTHGPIRFHDWLGGSWAILFSHPKNFTPVCTTELGYVERIQSEFGARGVKVIGLSLDTVDSHHRWGADIAATQGAAPSFPVIADADQKVARLFDMLHPEVVDVFTVRAVYVIGPDRKVKATLSYPASTGRNFDEILRLIDSLQLTAKHSVATPANWRPGGDCFVASSLSDEAAREKFPQGWTAARPYLRVVPQPGS